MPDERPNKAENSQEKLSIIDYRGITKPITLGGQGLKYLLKQYERRRCDVWRRHAHEKFNL